MKARPVLAVAGWLVTAMIATGAGVAVITVVGEALWGAEGRVLSPEEVRRALATAALVTPGTPMVPTTPTASAIPEPGGTERVISTDGGTVIARCADGLVTLRSWNPAQGYHVDDADRGPARRAEVEFEAEDAKIKIEIRCGPDGLPTYDVRTD